MAQVHFQTPLDAQNSLFATFWMTKCPHEWAVNNWCSLGAGAGAAVAGAQAVYGGYAYAGGLAICGAD